eukprot:SAG31_NODE_24015_length_491_cov_0.744898_1_plen_72_part_10
MYKGDTLRKLTATSLQEQLAHAVLTEYVQPALENDALASAKSKHDGKAWAKQKLKTGGWKVVERSSSDGEPQ